MGQRNISDQQITEYLLGSESDAELIDELSIRDDEFAARLDAVENDLVDAYVRGELSGKTLESFDLHYRSSPSRRAKVSIAQGLKDVLDGEAVAPGVPAKATVPAARDHGESRWESLRRYFLLSRGLQAGLAAAFLLILAIGVWLVFNYSRLREEADQASKEVEEVTRREHELRSPVVTPQPRATVAQALPQSPPRSEPLQVFSFILAPQLRGPAEQVPTIAVPASADQVALHLDLEAGNFTAYRAELKTQPGNQTVWRSGNLQARDERGNKAVVVTLRPSLITGQRYVVELSGISAGGRPEIVGSYQFQVTKP